MNQPTDQAATSGAGDNMGSAAGQTGQTGQGGDMLDKGVNYAEQESGHQESPATTEKISDGLRSGFKKVTGKDVPIKDQQDK